MWHQKIITFLGANPFLSLNVKYQDTLHPPYYAALLGLVIAIIVNEVCDNLLEGEPCKSTFINILKAATSLSTLATAFFLIWQMSLTCRLDATKASLITRQIKYKPAKPDHPHKPEPAPIAQRGSTPALLAAAAAPRLVFLGYLALNCVHTVPGVSFVVHAEMLGMDVVYRVEALITVRAPLPSSVQGRGACNAKRRKKHQCTKAMRSESGLKEAQWRTVWYLSAPAQRSPPPPPRRS